MPILNRTALVLGTIVFLGFGGCGGGTGTRKTGVDASVADNEGGSQAGATTDSNDGTGGIGGSVDSRSFGGAVADVGDRIEAADVGAVGTADVYADRNGGADACAAVTVDVPPGELSVEEVLEGADTLACVLLNVSGKVFEDARQKRGDWPAPALSLFILQDGGRSARIRGQRSQTLHSTLASRQSWLIPRQTGARDRVSA